MIPIATIKPLLKYFDSIDEAGTAGLMSQSPSIETTITDNLCSLLDQKEQKTFNLKYTFKLLQKNLSKVGAGLKVLINTHEYNSSLENRVTQWHWYRLVRGWKSCNTRGSTKQANLE